MLGGNRLKGTGWIGLFSFLVLMGLSTGCHKESKKEALPIPTVEVVKVKVKDVPIYSEWTASIDGFVNAAIRAQVQGYLIKREYKEGDFVRKGQGLFRIDPRTFQAALDQAQGQLTEQRARWENAKANLERIKPLVEQKAVSQKDLDDAVSTEKVTHAAVIAAQAMVDKAKVDLGFTTITSPIEGIAGISRAQIGDLVGPGIPGELTYVSTVDPIKVYIPMSELEYLRYVVKDRNRVQYMPLELMLADGTIHPHLGHFAFAGRSVDVGTGTIRVVALFPNPGNVLRPGQFARVRAKVETRKDALLVPQRAVSEIQSSYQIAVVGPDNKVSVRSVKVGERIDTFWIIKEGLKAGEKVISEGFQKVKDGSVVKTIPYQSDLSSSPPTPDSPAIRPKTGVGIKDPQSKD